MAKRFKVGDLVQLKSGGRGTKEGDVWCHWFGGRKLERGQFPEESRAGRSY